MSGRARHCRPGLQRARARSAAERTPTGAGVAGIALAAAALLAGAATPAAAQEETPPAAEAPEPGARPEADPDDVGSIDAIVLALYDVISGAAGEERDWDRFRSLMYPGAVLLPAFPEQGEGPAPMTVEEFVESSREYTEEEGFFERELARSVQRYGPVANVFSTYESRNEPDAEPFVRGINSIQLVHDGDRWWVAHIAWTDEREAGPIPERYGGEG